MKKILAVVLAAVMVLSLAACASKAEVAEQAVEAAAEANAAAKEAVKEAVEEAVEEAVAEAGEPIRIGTLYPLTGAVAAIGENIMKGINFAVDEINAEGGIYGRPIELVSGDTQGDPKTAMSEAERLMTQENIVCLLGCYQSGVTEVVAPIAEQYQIPMITAISTADVLTTRGYDYFFRMCPTNSMYTRDMINFLAEYGKKNPDAQLKSIAVCADNTTLGQEMAQWAKYFGESAGLEYKGEVLYTKDAADLSSEVLSLKTLAPDALVVDNYISDGILLTKTMSEQGFRPNIMIGKATAYIDPSYIPAVGSLGEGIVTATEFSPGNKGVDVSDAFKAEYGVDMNGHSAEAYTAVKLYKQAIEDAIDATGDATPEAIKAALSEIKIEGSFRDGQEIILPYDKIEFVDVDMNGQQHHNTNASAQLTIIQIRDGGYVTVYPFSIAKEEVEYPTSFGKK